MPIPHISINQLYGDKKIKELSWEAFKKLRKSKLASPFSVCSNAALEYCEKMGIKAKTHDLLKGLTVDVGYTREYYNAYKEINSNVNKLNKLYEFYELY